MLRSLVIFISLSFAFLILVISILRISSPKYSFYQPDTIQEQSSFSTHVNYNLPDPGIGPDNPFWFFKALRDKIWLETTTDPLKRAQLLLLFADKRLSQASYLLEEGKADLGVPTVLKAEQYLQEAYKMENEAYALGIDTAEITEILARASLKHREVIEKNIAIAPDDAKPTLSQINDIPKEVYEKSVQRLNEKGKKAPLSQ